MADWGGVSGRGPVPQELSMVVHIFKKMKEQKKGKKIDLHRAQEQSLWEVEGCMEITCMEMYGDAWRACLWNCGHYGAFQSCSGSEPVLSHTPAGFCPVDPL